MGRKIRQTKGTNQEKLLTIESQEEKNKHIRRALHNERMKRNKNRKNRKKKK